MRLFGNCRRCAARVTLEDGRWCNCAFNQAGDLRVGKQHWCCGRRKPVRGAPPEIEKRRFVADAGGTWQRRSW